MRTYFRCPGSDGTRNRKESLSCLRMQAIYQSKANRFELDRVYECILVHAALLATQVIGGAIAIRYATEYE
jgi:hypothetical protein